MMRYSPTLRVNRVVVMRKNAPVYDEMFHAGVNILRGDNSSGKSTILNFIFYGLGGELTEWSEKALLCDRVYVEAALNGLTVTMSREVSKEPRRSMDIFAGPYESSLNAPTGEWARYPYTRTAQLESFSQVIFRLLKMPEVTSDETGNLTIHQVLRLLYADQLSPVDQIFFHEPFDPPILRDSVGRLLCGAYDSEIYNNEVRLRDLTRRFDQANAELKSLFAVLGRTDQAHTLEWVAAQQQALDVDRQRIQGQIEALETQLYAAGAHDRVTLKAQEQAYREAQQLQGEIAALREERDALELTISDSDMFIASLERRIEALSDSQLIAENLGGIRFRTCPACYAAIDSASEEHQCHLCRTPFEEGPAHNRIVALINDAGRQLKQSRILQERRREQHNFLHQRMAVTEEKWARASRRLSDLQRLPSGEMRSRLRQLNREAGYLDRQAEDLDSKAKLAAEIATLTETKANLNAKIDRLKTRNNQLKASQEKRLNQSFALVEREILDFLHNDLKRQDAFVNAKHVKFDFSANSIGVDEGTYFSASSRVILKSSFFVGLLFASTVDREFRHPRFCMIDTVEDKGMEQIRSHNFQRLIVARSEKASAEHQIIFATAMIAPELNSHAYVVGRHSTLEHGTLNMIGPSLESLI